MIDKDFIYRNSDVDEILTVITELQKLENFVWIINERAITSNSSAFFDGEIPFYLF